MISLETSIMQFCLPAAKASNFKLWKAGKSLLNERLSFRACGRANTWILPRRFAAFFLLLDDSPGEEEEQEGGSGVVRRRRRRRRRRRDHQEGKLRNKGNKNNLFFEAQTSYRRVSLVSLFFCIKSSC